VVVVINSDDVVRLGQPPVAELWCEEVGVEETRMKHDDCWTRGVDVGLVGVRRGRYNVVHLEPRRDFDERHGVRQTEDQEGAKRAGCGEEMFEKLVRFTTLYTVS